MYGLIFKWVIIIALFLIIVGALFYLFKSLGLGIW